MNQTELQVREFTPQKINKRNYSIPLYQRLYSWEEEQVKQLLDDLHDSFNIDSSREYFIGNIVTSSVDKITERNALIDGQQRMTTLWLMGFVLKKYYENWSTFILQDSILRLDFVARKEDRAFLEKLTKTNIDQFLENEVLEEGVNRMMVNTINIVNSYFKKVEKKEVFARYIYEKSKLVELTLPNTTDLNKYFEIMNNRGVQLEKHEILKARLIDKIFDEDKEIEEKKKKKYSTIWDACSQMNRDIERSFEKQDDNINIREEIKMLIKSNFNNLDKFIAKISSGINNEDKTFEDILNEIDINKNKEKAPDIAKDNNDAFTSIVNFPSFLLHVYKIHKSSDNIKISLKDKDLLKTINFEKTANEIDNSNETISFINELFKFRILFDQYIIRSYKTGINNLWETRILSIEENENESERKKAFENATQILSLLNASTSTEHWLTPVLKYLRDTTGINDISYTTWLENLDNCFAYTRTTEKKEMMQTANNILADIHNVEMERLIKIDVKKLSYTEISDNYWFYKLEYCLWKKWTNEDYQGPWKSEIKSFQFRSNRSIEHVYPQHPENGEKWEADLLNSFGNLALISVSSNSGYNNQLPSNKKHDFEKRINNWGIESLKLADVYSRDNWNKDECENHQFEMIKVLEDYHIKANSWQNTLM